MENSTSSSCYANLGGTKLELDSFRCFLAGFSLILLQINFGYICLVLLLIIMVISIFGGIKENYRWYIFNQAAWDLILSYRFICFNWMSFAYIGSGDSTCVYDVSTGIFKSMFDYSFVSNYYSPLTLLSFTRFLALYFSDFYQKLTQKRRLLYLILGFNFFVIITTFSSVFNNLQNDRKDILKGECLAKNYSNNMTSCPPNDDFLIQFFGIMSIIFYCITFIKPSICLLVSVVSSFLIILKILKKIKFQQNAHTKSKDLKSNIRICVVISLQTLINIFIFIIETLRNIPMFIGSTLGIMSIFQTYVLPTWLGGPYGLTDYGVVQAITQFRILVESLIILFVMTGYRESIVKFFKKLKAILLGKTTSAIPKATNASKIFPLSASPIKKSMTAVTS